MTVQRQQADMVVIGGGVIGLAIAYEAAYAGDRVIVLDAQQPGGGASAVAAGMLAPASEVEGADDALVALAVESVRRYPEWVTRLEQRSQCTCGYRTEGTLLIALSRDHLEELERMAAIQARLGLPTAFLSQDAIQEREPFLTSRAIAALDAPNDRQVNPRRLAQALLTAIRAAGGVVIAHAEGARAELTDGRVTGASYGNGSERQEIRTTAVVIAAGAWSRTAMPPEAAALQLRPVKGQVLRLRGQPLIRHIIRSPDVYLVPRVDGELVVGATMEEQGFDARPTAGAVHDLLHEAMRVLPGISELELTETGVGFRPALRDNLPAIGATSVEGLYLATGHYRHGVMLAPTTAELLYRLIRTGTTDPLLRPFAPARLAGPRTPRTD